jgi:hypothetical protein
MGKGMAGSGALSGVGITCRYKQLLKIDNFELIQ